MIVHCAERMDSGTGARTDISAIKILVPSAYGQVVDRAIQEWGAAGVSGDLPLAAMQQGARTLRLADGPDEVHRILIAKNVLVPARAGISATEDHAGPGGAATGRVRSTRRARCARRGSDPGSSARRRPPGLRSQTAVPLPGRPARCAGDHRC